MPQLPSWPRRVAVLGMLALAGVLLTSGCRSEALPAPESQGGATREPVAASPSADPASEEPAWGDATARARAATFSVYVHEEGLYGDHYDDAGQVVDYYDPTSVLAFYIGNNEWISVGSFGTSPAFPPGRPVRYGLRWGVSRGFHGVLEHDVRPVTVIGSDRATRIALLRASGAGVAPLRLASALPPPCTPLVLAVYWATFSEDDLAARRATGASFPETCNPSIVRDTYLELGGLVLDHGGDMLPIPNYFFPGLAGTALARVATDAGIPILVLDPSGGMDWPTWLDSVRRGAPVVTADGTVVGVYRSWFAQAVALPAIEAAIAGIREDVAARAEKQICLDVPLSALRDCLARGRAAALDN